MTLTDVERAARELLRLANEERWSRAGTAAAYREMRRLRASGFTNEDISQLTRPRWGLNAVKKATAGTNVTAPDDAQSVMQTLTDILARNIPLPSLETATTIYQQAGTQFPTILELLSELAKLKIPLKDFLEDYAKMKEQKLTPQNVKQALNYKEDLEKENLNLASLSQIKGVAEKYGDFSKIMVALETYGSLQAIQKDVTTKTIELEASRLLVDEAEKRLKAHKQLEEASKELLKSYGELQKNLTEAISKMPNNLTTSLDNVTTEFKTKSEKELKALFEQISTSANKELSATTEELTALKNQFTTTKQELSSTTQTTVDDVIAKVKSIQTKTSEAMTKIESDYKEALESSETQATKLRSTLDSATADSTKKVDDLAAHAVEVGKRVDQIEAWSRQNQPYLELTYFADKRTIQYVSPRVLSTLKVILRGFAEWLGTSPACIKNPFSITGSTQQLMRDLETEVPDV